MVSCEWMVVSTAGRSSRLSRCKRDRRSASSKVRAEVRSPVARFASCPVVVVEEAMARLPPRALVAGAAAVPLVEGTPRLVVAAADDCGASVAGGRLREF